MFDPFGVAMCFPCEPWALPTATESLAFRTNKAPFGAGKIPGAILADAPSIVH